MHIGRSDLFSPEDQSEVGFMQGFGQSDLAARALPALVCSSTACAHISHISPHLQVDRQAGDALLSISWCSAPLSVHRPLAGPAALAVPMRWRCQSHFIRRPSRYQRNPPRHHPFHRPGYRAPAPCPKLPRGPFPTGASRPAAPAVREAPGRPAAAPSPAAPASCTGSSSACRPRCRT